MITVFFRYDDFSALSPTAVDGRLMDVFARNGCCCTFAVIPNVTTGSYREPGDRPTCPLRGDKLDELRRGLAAGAVDVALHGWDHRSLGARPLHSEFSGLPLAAQRSRITLGVEFFEQTLGMRPAVFVPPWNTYDENTLRALEECRVMCISANRYSPALRSAPLRYVPITAEFSDLRRAVAEARVSDPEHAIIGVLIHPYDFRESGDPRATITAEAVDGELRWLAAQDGVVVRAVTDIVRSNPSMDVNRLRMNQPLRLESATPPRIRTTSMTPIYYSTHVARIRAWRRAAGTTAVYAGIAFVAAVVAAFASGVLSVVASGAVRPVAMAIAAAAILLLVHAIRSQRIYFKPMAAVSFLTGFAVGLFVPS